MASSPAMSSLPQMPPTARSKDDAARSSEESERRRLLHNSWQTAFNVPSIAERPSQEASNPASPTRAQIVEWEPQPLIAEPQDMARQSSQDSRPMVYGRSTSNDYTVFGASTPTPRPTTANTTNVPYNPLQYQNDDAFTQRPYKRAPTTGLRDKTDGQSIKAGRYTPLGNCHTPKKSASFAPYAQQWQEQDTTFDSPHASNKTEETPSKARRSQGRLRGTSVYFVREGSHNGAGGGPPDAVLQLPFQGWLKGPLRASFVAWLGEFVGTTLFLWFAFAGTLVANIGAQQSSDNTTTNETVGFSPIVNLYVAVSFGFSLMVNVWIFFRVSGGLFNPAVTLGMVMVKAIDYVRGFLLVTAQLTGAIFASFLVQVMFPYEFNVRTTLSASTSVTRGVFIEMVLTAELVFTIFMLAKEKHKATYMAPVGIGLALFVAELVGVFFTGGSLNPARSFGPCVTTGNFDPEHWVYWVGPSLGAILAVAFYRFIKMLEYEQVNGDQDLMEHEAAEQASLRAAKRNSVYNDKDAV